MATNMYRVGDYVYFETASTSPYQVRRIEELNKTPHGNVEAKVMCFFRRRDLPSSLTYLADKHQSALEEEEGKDRESLSSKQRHLLKHRELFLSRQVETLPATHIRGKCSVTLLNETECLLSYLNKEDSFFYSLVYDPQQKTLLADRGEIRVGQRYQAEASKSVLKEGETDGRNLEELETLVWTPNHSLTDKQIDQFLVISRSVGTFARALDCSSSVKQPSLHMSAAAASRDVTLFHAMDTLHKYSYDISTAVSALVPSFGPVLCRDEMEEWSASEANLFEEALEKYGKDFTDIRSDFLPWKTLKNIIEYYYMWKTTDRYVQQKRVKAAEAETKLKQVYIPNYNKPNPAALSGGIKGILNGSGTPDQLIPGKPCESCMTTSSTQWYACTGSSGLQARLCHPCWNYWRKYGGLKTANKLHDVPKSVDGEIEMVKKVKSPPSPMEEGEAVERAPGLMQPRLHRCAVAGCNKDFKMKNQLARHYATSHGFSMRSGSPRPVMKTRTAFYLHTTPMTRVARRVCSDILKPRHATRSPFWPVNIVLVKTECHQRITDKTAEELKMLVTGRKRKLPNARVTEIAHKLGQPDRVTPEWLVLTDKSKLPQPEKVAFPKPPKGPDGSLIYERVPDKSVSINNVLPSLLKRRGYDEFHEVDGETPPPAKRVAWDNSNTPPAPKSSSRGASPLPLTVQQLPATANANTRNVLNQIANGTKTKIASVTRVGSRKQIISWMDAPDDLYFSSTEGTKKLRRSLTSTEMRRLARSPCKKVISKGVSDPPPPVVPPIPTTIPLPVSLVPPPIVPTEHL
ncbi:unnamed protein product [Allacma fusca]|uniref:Metastasis-associated protein MTA3 n=1 Tax=Allacma fusca TaxID=39272 RepID=A0A8J2PUX1_9HEXA|nr:unnamed protein product [Allacma fusca]